VDIDNIEFSLHGIKTLEIRGYGIWPSFPRLDEMLSGSSSLRRLILHVKPAEVLQQVRSSSETNRPHHSGQILLPELVYLEVYTSEWLTEDVAEFLQLFACPKLRLLTMRESVTSTSEKANMVMTYSAIRQGSGSPSVNSMLADPWDENTREITETDISRQLLWVRSASVYHACSALSFSGASTLTTLELHKVFFPRLALMKEMFAALKNLTNLLILDFVPHDILDSIMGVEGPELDELDWEETHHSVVLPSLQRLLFEFKNSVSSVSSWEQATPKQDHTSSFLRLFHVPSLSSLVLKGASLPQWRGTTEVFARAEDAYPKLTSLKIMDMTEPIPSDPHEPGYVDAVRAFPRLEKLSLKGVNSNVFLKSLVDHLHCSSNSPISPTTTVVWPKFHTLSISNDANASKPLLHRAISSRENAGFPIVGLYLDNHFNRNAESWQWMKEKVPVLKLVEVDAGWGVHEMGSSPINEVGGWH